MFLSQAYPEVSKEIKTVIAAANLLHQQNHIVRELQQKGVLITLIIYVYHGIGLPLSLL